MKLKKLTDEEQHALLADLASALAGYDWKAGRDPDTPAGQRRTIEQLLAKRPDHIGGSPPPITPENAHEVAELREWLRRFERPRSSERPGSKTTKRAARLTKAADVIKELRERWRALPLEIQLKIGLPSGEIQKDPDGTETFVPLEPSDADLVAAAERIHGMPGRPRDEPLDDLLKVLVECYSDYSQDRGIARRGGVEHSERYHGPLLDFALDLLETHAIRYHSRGALGERLYKIADNWWKKSRQNKHSQKPH